MIFFSEMIITEKGQIYREIEVKGCGLEGTF